MKKCTKCGEVKPLSEFHKKSTGKDGLKARCKQCENARVRAWRKKNPAKARAIPRRWNKKNSKWWKNYCRTHRAKIRAYKRKYRRNNAGKMNRATAQRRAHKSEADRDHTDKEFYILCQRHGCRCLCCGHVFPLDCLTEDHIVPLSKGGSDWIKNIQPLCRKCNGRKGAKIQDYRGEEYEQL